MRSINPFGRWGHLILVSPCSVNRSTRSDKRLTRSLKQILSSWKSISRNKWKNWTRRIKCWSFINDNSPKRMSNSIFRRSSSRSKQNLVLLSLSARSLPSHSSTHFAPTRNEPSHSTIESLRTSETEDGRGRNTDRSSLHIDSRPTRKSSNTRKSTDHYARWPSPIVFHPSSIISTWNRSRFIFAVKNKPGHAKCKSLNEKGIYVSEMLDIIQKQSFILGNIFRIHRISSFIDGAKHPVIERLKRMRRIRSVRFSDDFERKSASDYHPLRMSTRLVADPVCSSLKGEQRVSFCSVTQPNCGYPRRCDRCLSIIFSILSASSSYSIRVISALFKFVSPNTMSSNFSYFSKTKDDDDEEEESVKYSNICLTK